MTYDAPAPRKHNSEGGPLGPTLKALNNHKAVHERTGRVNGYAERFAGCSDSAALYAIQGSGTEQGLKKWLQEEIIYRYTPHILNAVVRHLKRNDHIIKEADKETYLQVVFESILEMLMRIDPFVNRLGAFISKHTTFACMNYTNTKYHTKKRSEAKTLPFTEESTNILEYQAYLRNGHDYDCESEVVPSSMKSQWDKVQFAMNPSNRVLTQIQSDALRKSYLSGDASDSDKCIAQKAINILKAWIRRGASTSSVACVQAKYCSVTRDTPSSAGHIPLNVIRFKPSSSYR